MVLVAVRGARARGVDGNAGGLTARSLQDPGEMFIQDSLRVFLTEPGREEAEGGRRLLGAWELAFISFFFLLTHTHTHTGRLLSP